MYKLTFLTLCISIFGASNARMPQELSKLLGIADEPEEMKTSLINLKDDLKKEPGTYLGSNFDLNKYIAQSPSNMASIETARMKLGSGDVEMYMPPKVTAVECHVEFQVTERVPGRCTRLAGSIPACQAEKYIGINYNECRFDE